MSLIERIATTKLPTPWGTFALVGFEETKTKQEHVALVFGEPLDTTKPVLTRIHSECLTGTLYLACAATVGPNSKKP